MNLLRVNFDELYRRHLCRHSQFGLNVLHLLAVVGIYFGLCQLIAAAVAWAGVERPVVVLGVLVVPYLGLLAPNVSFRIWVATALSVTAIIAASMAVPTLPWWISLLLILGLHQFQQVSHRFYPLARDMSAFQQKYVKGPRLFLLLSLYELPILLHYLLFGAVDWVFGAGMETSA